jgi:hypothetical protein
LGWVVSWCIYVSWRIHPTSQQEPADADVPISHYIDTTYTGTITSTNTTTAAAAAATIVELENHLARVTTELERATTHAKNNKQRAEQLQAKVQVLESGKSGNASSWSPASNSNSNSNNINTANICRQIPSSLKDWVDRINVPLDAGHDHLHDPTYALRDLNAMALEFITPRLARSLEGFPHRNLDKLLQKAQARYEYLQNPARAVYQKTTTTMNTTAATTTAPSPPPPIRIYVSGGSVADGQNCGTPLLKKMTGNQCSWPRRLQVLVNNLVGGDMIEVVNGARGGANTRMGKVALAYVLPPSQQQQQNQQQRQQPLDIVINAHSVNDQIEGTVEEAKLYNLSLSQYTFDMAQNFTRFVAHHHPDAALIWLEDHVGNKQLNLLKAQEFSKQIHTLSKYYGFGVLSYTDAVRDVVYGDTHETALTPEWYDRGGTTTMVREVHPGIVMHACVAYLWLYYGWNLLQQACSGYDQLSISYNSTSARDADGGARWPRSRPEGMLPRLTTDLSLEHVSDLWRASTTTTTTGSTTLDNHDDNNHDDDDDGGDAAAVTRYKDETSCPFQWTAGLQKEKNLTGLEEHSQRVFSPYLQLPTTWKLMQRDFGKGRFGWAHYESFINSSVQEQQQEQIQQQQQQQQQPLRLTFPFEGIQTLALFVAKNKDPDWVDSSVVVTIWNDQKAIVKRQRIHGFQASPDDPIPPKRPKKRQIKLRMTRQVYLEEVDLSTVFPSSKNLTIQLEHVSGVGFKFMGMSLCRFPPVMDGVAALMNNW